MVRRIARLCAQWVGLSILGCFLLLMGSGSAASSTPTLSPSNTKPDDEIRITIYRRRFEPSIVTIGVGRKTKLIFHNQDAELHSVVPMELLSGVHMNILGNGAPQFDAKGLKRVIIPPKGRSEIRFIPTREGIFPYFCDMPGHQMSATIEVQ